MDTTTLLSFALVGGFGGLFYSYANKLLTVATYLVAVEHIASGLVVGAAIAFGVFGSGYPAPVDWPTAIPTFFAGYGATDLIDSLAAKLKTATPPTATP